MGIITRAMSLGHTFARFQKGKFHGTLTLSRVRLLHSTDIGLIYSRRREKRLEPVKIIYSTPRSHCYLLYQGSGRIIVIADAIDDLVAGCTLNHTVSNMMFPIILSVVLARKHSRWTAVRARTKDNTSTGLDCTNCDSTNFELDCALFLISPSDR